MSFPPQSAEADTVQLWTVKVVFMKKLNVIFLRFPDLPSADLTLISESSSNTNWLRCPDECCALWMLNTRISIVPGSPHYCCTRLFGEVVQSRRRPLLGPSPSWKWLLLLSHLNILTGEKSKDHNWWVALRQPVPCDLCVAIQFHVYSPWVNDRLA